MTTPAKGNQLDSAGILPTAPDCSLRETLHAALASADLTPSKRSYYIYVGAELVRLIEASCGWLDYIPADFAKSLHLANAQALFAIVNAFINAGVFAPVQSLWVIGNNGKPKQVRRLMLANAEV